MKEKRKLLLELFTSTLYLSAFTFGGGYVIVSLLKERRPKGDPSKSVHPLREKKIFFF